MQETRLLHCPKKRRIKMTCQFRVAMENKIVREQEITVTNPTVIWTDMELVSERSEEGCDLDVF
jgi:hypothetical protein